MQKLPVLTWADRYKKQCTLVRSRFLRQFTCVLHDKYYSRQNSCLVCTDYNLGHVYGIQANVTEIEKLFDSFWRWPMLQLWWQFIYHWSYLISPPSKKLHRQNSSNFSHKKSMYRKLLYIIWQLETKQLDLWEASVHWSSDLSHILLIP